MKTWTLPLPLPTDRAVALVRLQEAVSRLTGKPSVLSRQKYAELRAPGWVCDPGPAAAGTRLRLRDQASRTESPKPWHGIGSKNGCEPDDIFQVTQAAHNPNDGNARPIEPPPVALRPSPFRHYTFIDYATQCYIAIVGMIIVFAHSPRVSFWPWMLLAHGTGLVLIHGLIQFHARHRTNLVLDFLRHFYPILLYGEFYHENGTAQPDALHRLPRSVFPAAGKAVVRLATGLGIHGTLSLAPG